MTSTTSARRTVVRVLGILTLFTAIAVLLQPAATRARASGTAPHPGLGFRLGGGDFVGFYVTADGTRIYCLDPRKAAPGSVALAPTDRITGLSATVTAAISYALTAWGDAHTATQAAVESQVLNTLAGNGSDVHRRAAALPRALGRSVGAHVAQALRLRGPYRVDLHLRGGAPGRTGLGSVRVRATTGHLVPGAAITLTGSANVAVPAHVHTPGSGVTEFHYRVLDVGQVRVTATGTGLADRSVRLAKPAAGQQRMVSWAPPATARTVASFGQHPSGFANSYSCTTQCAGRPSTRLTACASASAFDSRIRYTVDGVVHTVNYRAGQVRSCRTLTLRLHDRDRVSAVWQYRTAHGWSRPVTAPGAFTVDCPPVPSVAVSMVSELHHRVDPDRAGEPIRGRLMGSAGQPLAAPDGAGRGRSGRAPDRGRHRCHRRVHRDGTVRGQGDVHLSRGRAALRRRSELRTGRVDHGSVTGPSASGPRPSRNPRRPRKSAR